jgi:CHAT domain-containing protein
MGEVVTRPDVLLGFFVSSILVPVLVKEALDNLPWLAEQLLERASFAFEEPLRSKYLLEWQGELDERCRRRGRLAILRWAFRVWLLSRETAAICRAEVTKPSLTIGDIYQHVNAAWNSVLAQLLRRLRSVREHPAAPTLTGVALVGLVIVGPPMLARWVDKSKFEPLAAGEHRPILAQLTGLPHAPLGVPTAGGQNGQAAGTDRVQLTAGRIRESFGDRQTPAQLHAMGVSHLLSGRYDDAAMSLLAASREQPQNARYLNDVATVQLERARRGVRPDDLPRALAAADRAVRLNPSLPEAWFNRGLAASALSLNDLAKASWTEYLKRDSSSAWAAEVRTRLEELSRPTPAALWTAMEGRLQQDIDAATAETAVRTQTTEARQLIERSLAEWANGNAAALQRARVMAAAMQRVAGDSLYVDSIAAIDRASAQGPAAAQAMANAHRTYAAAVTLFMQDRFVDAAPGLNAAKTQFAALGSPFAHRAAVEIAGTRFTRGDFAGALAAVSDAKAAGQTSGYAHVTARASWFEGLVAFAQYRLGDTQAHYEDTLSGFERMGDAEQVALAHNLLSAFYGYLGDRPNEWKHRQRAMLGLSVSRSERFKAVLLGSSAVRLRADFPETALALHDAVLAAERERGRHGFIVETLAYRASTNLVMGREVEAAADVREARRALALVTDPRLRETHELLLLAPEGELQRTQDPVLAAETAARALDIIRMRNSPADRSRVPAFQLQLAKAHIDLGNLAAAKAALAAGIRTFDAERALFSDEGRVSQFDESWHLFETAVQLAIDEKDYPRAFELSERARARSLAEARQPAGRSLGDIQTRLGHADAVVALNQFDDELAIWVIRHSSINVIKRPLTRLDATRLVARQQDEIWQEARTPSASRDLYSEIIRPAASALRGASTVAFVPDATYQDASFAAFWDGSRRRFLAEDVTLSVALGVDAYISSRTTGDGNTRPRSLLVLGGPEGTSDDDARAVASMYHPSSLVTGGAATPRRFLSDAGAHSLVHVVAKTVPNRAFPLLSQMVLADEPGRRHSGAVLGRDIAARQMQTDVVVLDEVDADSADHGEGTVGLARAFMTAGVPAVLGTLPGAEKNATRDLMIGFHREMASGVSAPQALSHVQRKAIRENGRRVGAWGRLVLYGTAAAREGVGK